ncbi:MAG: hypothetical protein QME94_14740 [Anaerolineae bacterium]|nr:hypothetical protein [Anaerolineae bacterium]
MTELTGNLGPQWQTPRMRRLAEALQDVVHTTATLCVEALDAGPLLAADPELVAIMATSATMLKATADKARERLRARVTQQA